MSNYYCSKCDKNFVKSSDYFKHTYLKHINLYYLTERRRRHYKYYKLYDCINWQDVIEW